MRKRLWSPEEDEVLRRFVERHGCGRWSQVVRLTGLQHRCPKSCRLRWVNYLRPGLKHGPFSKQELQLLLCLHNHFGNRWSQIAAYMPGRSDNDVKNAWHLCNRRQQRGPSNDKDCDSPFSLLSMGCNDYNDKMSTLVTSCSSNWTQFLPQNDTLTLPSNVDQPPEGLHQVVWSFINKRTL
ncbi:hypothetical protein L7F22_000122 [Adiantum nelumboides]|nr:hypothetical protein [Adiantum nelumboides]